MKKTYESPDAELIVLRPNKPIAYISGTDGDKDGVQTYNDSGLGGGGLGLSGGGEENERG